MNLINSFSFQLPEGQKMENLTASYSKEVLPPVNDVQVHFRVKQAATSDVKRGAGRVGWSEPIAALSINE
ncbi:hypothetical protein C0Q70_14990 [Pomacea canaliculata]|uniref:Uncharacterized protein n=1 Tax=Pomacea canaliculata TaxID=400727 RepID=A0A2T7NTK2_POMCA|nr:hypothetical protein C0Q70_14990 [Pomacea canaliculata]